MFFPTESTRGHNKYQNIKIKAERPSKSRVFFIELQGTGSYYHVYSGLIFTTINASLLEVMEHS